LREVAMPLQQLVPSGGETAVQNTTFSVDALGRYLCSTWDEAVGNSGGSFSAVVIGAGMYGAYCAAQIRRRHPSKRVLVLDAGRLLVSEHVQNLARIGLGVPGPIAPSADPGTARELVWGLPWRGNVDFPGLAYCIGGKSLYWGGWCPRLTDADLQEWPSAAAQYLKANYSRVESETGVVPGTDFIFGELYDVLRAEVAAAVTTTPNIESLAGANGIEAPPLAVQGSPPASGLFSFDKYSSVPILAEALRDDVRSAEVNDANRRLFLVPNAHVIRMHTSAGRVQAIELDAGGQRRFLPVQPDCAVILAASAIESTRMALESFPTPLMGCNLMAHVRSDFTVRVRRSAWATIPGHVQTAALLVRGSTPSGRFHLQVTASTHAAGSDELLFRMIPDLEILEAQLANQDSDWITITFRAIGEMRGDRAAPSHHPSRSWIDLSPYETDEFGARRAFVQIKAASSDLQVWQAMDQTALVLAQKIARHPADIEYLYDGGWKKIPFPLDRAFPEWHRGLGTTYHESGTLWMGESAATSVTNDVGRFHHVENAYACDQSLFPTVGSVNPV
jgi:choline dehydrogenase-like flavoprotein